MAETTTRQFKLNKTQYQNALVTAISQYKKQGGQHQTLRQWAATSIHPSATVYVDARTAIKESDPVAMAEVDTLFASQTAKPETLLSQAKGAANDYRCPGIRTAEQRTALQTVCDNQGDADVVAMMIANGFDPDDAIARHREAKIMQGRGVGQ